MFDNRQSRHSYSPNPISIVLYQRIGLPTVWNNFVSGFSNRLFKQVFFHFLTILGHHNQSRIVGTSKNTGVARNGFRTKSYKVFLVPERGFISAERFTWVVLFHLGFVELLIRLPIISGFRTGIFDLNSMFLRFPVSVFKQTEIPK